MGTVELVTMESRLIAAVRRRTSVGKVPAVILPALDVVWTAVRAHGASFGKNVAVYRCIDGDQIDAEFGVEVADRFDDPGEVSCVETPTGTAATMTHVGPYRGMAKTYGAIASWMRERQYRASGVSMEVYGHWVEDESRLTTEIYVLIANQ